MNAYVNCHNDTITNDILKMTCDHEMHVNKAKLFVSTAISCFLFITMFCLCFMGFYESRCKTMCGDSYDSCNYCQNKKYYRFFIKLFGLFKLNFFRDWLKKKSLQV